jgi:hypothetical protein
MTEQHSHTLKNAKRTLLNRMPCSLENIPVWHPKTKAGLAMGHAPNPHGVVRESQGNGVEL